MSDWSGAVIRPPPPMDDLAVADCVEDDPTSTVQRADPDMLHVPDTMGRWVCGVACFKCHGAVVVDVRRTPLRCPFCRAQDWQADGDGTRVWA